MWISFSILIIAILVLALFVQIYWFFYPEKRDAFSLKHNKLFIASIFFAFVILTVIFYMGFNELLYFIPERWGSYDEDGEFITRRNEFANLLAICFTGLLTTIVYQHNKLRNQRDFLKDALNVLRYKNPEGFYLPERLTGDLSMFSEHDWFDYSSKKDLALGILLKESWTLFSYRKDELKNILLNYGPKKLRYDALNRLDNHINVKLQEREKQKYPEAIFEIRKYLLSNYSIALQQKKFLVYTNISQLSEDYLYAGTLVSTNEHPEIVKQFCQHVLNDYYKGNSSYKLQPENFSYKDFIQYLSQISQRMSMI
jgi:L-rhamnose mutarotase